LEHSDQEVKDETTQSIGHAWTLHCCDDARVGHAVPPCAGLIEMLRALVCEPPPQVTEHEVQSPHAETTQSMGQAWVLQSWVCEV
jgi:hypothetical protein